MLNFSKPANQYPTSAKKAKPTGYKVLKITKSYVGESSNKNPMWTLELDISEGKHVEYFSKYPLKWRQVLNTEIGEKIAAQVVQQIVSSNVGMIDPNAVNAVEFDESVVTGLNIGGKLKLNEKGYVEVDSLCHVDYARKNCTDAAF
jgi:hypothetical protein